MAAARDPGCWRRRRRSPSRRD
uniref:Uncharacterized protein n=1 Tax=Arundo donax TaxID=35708 RepID=A0A0A8ZIP3_ARUDO